MTLFTTRSGIVFVLSAILTAAPCAEDADALRQKGVDALKDSQVHPRAIVDAARSFAKAAQAYSAAGDEEKAVEMSSYLYWCKKKMSMEDIDAFVKGGEEEVVATINAAAEKKVDANAAQAWMDRAEAYERKMPNEHLLLAIRYFEVADRFKGTEISFQAQDRSLKEQTLALGQAAPAAPVKKKPAAAVEKKDPAEAKVEKAPKQPVPPPAKVRDAVKELKEILKDEYTKSKPEDKVALAKKLILMASDANNDAVTKYAELNEAGELAAAAGDVVVALGTIKVQDASFVVDAYALRVALLKTTLDAAKSKDVCHAVADVCMSAIDEFIEADQFVNLPKLNNVCDTAVTRALNPELSAQYKLKSAAVMELLHEWPAAKTALEKAKADEKNASANLTAGKFVCFLKGDMEHGLPLLSKGGDAALKKLADSDLANPVETADQVAVGDAWWDLSEAEKSRRSKFTMLGRAGHWYAKTLTSVSGLAKVKIDKRLASISAILGAGFSIGIDLSGKWTVAWPDHPEYGKRTCEFRADGSIFVGPGENFGAYKPSKWVSKSKQVSIQYLNGETSIFKMLDDNRFKQDDGGDAVYSRKTK